MIEGLPKRLYEIELIDPNIELRSDEREEVRGWDKQTVRELESNSVYYKKYMQKELALRVGKVDGKDIPFDVEQVYYECLEYFYAKKDYEYYVVLHEDGGKKGSISFEDYEGDASSGDDGLDGFVGVVSLESYIKRIIKLKCMNYSKSLRLEYLQRKDSIVQRLDSSGESYDIFDSLGDSGSSVEDLVLLDFEGVCQNMQAYRYIGGYDLYLYYYLKLMATKEGDRYGLDRLSLLYDYCLLVGIDVRAADFKICTVDGEEILREFDKMCGGSDLEFNISVIARYVQGEGTLRKVLSNHSKEKAKLKVRGY